jgi:hypothetical protein
VLKASCAGSDPTSHPNFPPAGFEARFSQLLEARREQPTNSMAVTSAPASSSPRVRTPVPGPICRAHPIPLVSLKSYRAYSTVSSSQKMGGRVEPYYTEAAAAPPERGRPAGYPRRRRCPSSRHHLGGSSAPCRASASAPAASAAPANRTPHASSQVFRMCRGITYGGHTRVRTIRLVWWRSCDTDDCRRMHGDAPLGPAR